jgi:hypothetical protein
LTTTFIGIGGSLVGGFVGALINRPTDGSMFHPAGLIMSSSARLSCSGRSSTFTF